ncbi:MAG: sodium-coupled permease, partial [Pirellulaceae bacterium]|nr:sodium-coupled permease [Pirellulaceae bacterium]
MHAADYIIAAAYVLGTIAMGFYFARRQTSSDEYFLGGRGFGWFPIAVSMVATLVSTTSFLSFPSEAYGHDMTILFYIVGVPPGILFVQKVFIPFYRRQNLTSIYEYLETRFGVELRSLTSGLFIFMRLMWMAVAVH